MTRYNDRIMRPKHILNKNIRLSLLFLKRSEIGCKYGKRERERERER